MTVTCPTCHSPLTEYYADYTSLGTGHRWRCLACREFFTGPPPWRGEKAPALPSVQPPPAGQPGPHVPLDFRAIRNAGIKADSDRQEFADTLPVNMTPVQVARRLAVSPRTVRRWCHDGTLKAYKNGGRWVVPRRVLLAMLGIHDPT